MDWEVSEGTVVELADRIREADSVVALTGAGVSVASGVPPFRGTTPDGTTGESVWDRHDPDAFHRRRLDADPAGFWTDRLDLRETMYGTGVEPNAAHEALVEMERAGHLDALVTQNVDGLHAAAGSPDVVRLHGRSDRVACDDCGRTRPAEAAFERVREGECPPTCECGGVYRPDVVLFGEGLPDEPFDRAQRAARRCDAFLALGSSLTVRPASLLPEVAAEAGATLVVVNLEETPVSDRAEYDLRADVTALLKRVTGRL
jgi:NAD-dependent deacetylase